MRLNLGKMRPIWACSRIGGGGIQSFEQPEESEAAHFVGQYIAVTNNTDARKGSAKNTVCCFVSKASVDAAPLKQILSCALRAARAFAVPSGGA